MTVTDTEVKNTMFLQALIEYHHQTTFMDVEESLVSFSGLFQIYDLDQYQLGTQRTVNDDLQHSRIVVYVAYQNARRYQIASVKQRF